MDDLATAPAATRGSEVCGQSQRLDGNYTTSRLDYALAYARQNRRVLPLWNVLENQGRFVCACRSAGCASPGKHPINTLAPNGAHSATNDIKTVEKWWQQYPAANIGLALDDITVIDVDTWKNGHLTAEPIQYLLNTTLTQKTGSGGTHHFYAGVLDIKGKPGIDIKKGSGHYVCAEPSRHVSGGSYGFLDFDIFNDSLEEKTLTMPEEVFASFSKKEAVNAGYQHLSQIEGKGFDDLSTHTRKLIRGDWDSKDCSEIVWRVIKDSIRAGLTDDAIRAICVNPDYSLLAIVQKHKGISWIDRMLPKAKAEIAAEHGIDDWQETPVEITTTLKPVLAFDFGLLPDAFKPWVSDIAHRMQCPPDYVAVSGMVEMSAIVGKKGLINPKAKDDWTVCPNLNGLNIGRPSAMKTPASNEGLKPLQRLEIKAKEAYDLALADNETQEFINKEGRALAEKEAKAHIKAKRFAAAKQVLLENSEEPGKPIRTRYLVNDATIEKLGELLNENPNGLMLYRDEISGFLKTIDREDRSNDRAFYLECFNGLGRYTYDRIGRGTIDIESLCLAILGNCNGQLKPDTFLDSLSIKIPLKLQRGLIAQF